MRRISQPKPYNLIDAIEMIDNGLIPFCLYGKKLATVAAALILDALKTPTVRGRIRESREKLLAELRRIRREDPIVA
jgi:hypothetical protein